MMAVTLATAAAPDAKTSDLLGALPRMTYEMAVAARIAFDARCPGFLARTLGGMPLTLTRRRSARHVLKLEFSSLAGDFSVAVDPAVDVRWALLADLARQPGRHALACDTATILLQRAAHTRRIDDVGLRVLAIGPVPPGGERATIGLPGCEFQLLEVDAALGLFASDEMRITPPPWPDELRALRLRGRLRLPSRVFEAGLLRSLATGDVVVFGTGPVRARWRVGGAAGLAADAWITPVMDRVELETGLTPDQEEAPMEHQERAIDLEQLELPLQFEIETASVSLDEIAALRPGHVIALDVAASRAVVRLRCQGQQVGTGQLVAIGEHLGVRIERMSWSRDVALR